MFEGRSKVRIYICRVSKVRRKEERVPKVKAVVACYKRTLKIDKRTYKVLEGSRQEGEGDFLTLSTIKDTGRKEDQGDQSL